MSVTGTTLLKSPCRTFPDETGFSLVELITVIIIIGIFTAIAIPNYLSWRENYELKIQTRELYSNMRKVKMSAIKENHDWGMVITDTATFDSYTILSSDGDDGTWNSGNETIASTVVLTNLPGGVIFQDPNGGSSSPFIVFRADGTSLAANIYLTNTSNSSFYRIQTHPAGGITMDRYTGTTWR